MPSESLSRRLATDTRASEFSCMKSPPVLIGVGSLLSTGRPLVLESWPPTINRLPSIWRPLSVDSNVVCSSGRPRVVGTGAAAVTSNAFSGIRETVLPPGIWTTGFGTGAVAARNGARAGSITMLEGTLEGGGGGGGTITGGGGTSVTTKPVVGTTTFNLSGSCPARTSLSMVATAAPLASTATTAAVASVTCFFTCSLLPPSMC